MHRNVLLLGVLFSVSLFGIVNIGDAYADTFTVVSNGNWNDPATWDQGAVPTDADDAIIPAGFNVVVNSDAEINSLHNLGSLNINNIEFEIYGVVTNDGDLQNNGPKELYFETDLINTNSFINNGLVTFEQGVVVQNSGSFTNTGNLNTNAQIQNTGNIDNFKTIDNGDEGEIQNLSGATFTNHSSGGAITNFGSITNFATFNNDGDITNSGTVTNDPAGTFTNTNGFTTDCDGVINGIISGIQPTSICSNNPPVFTSFPADIVTPTDAGKNYAKVSYPFPIAVDGTEPATVTQIAGLTSNSQFPLGVTLNTFVAIDAQGQSTTQSFTVTVNDIEAPTIKNVPNDITKNNDPGLPTAVVTWIPPTPTASDNVGIASFSSSHAPGSAFPIGMTMVTYTAVDTAGNSASVSFYVTVNDVEIPIISGVPADITQDNDPGLSTAIVTWTAPTATDNSGSVTLTSTHNSGDTFLLGTTTVTYTATDAAGNSASASFDVTVNDAEDPVISGVPADIMVPTDLGLTTAVVTWTAPTATDNSGSVTLTSTHNPGDSFPLGTTTVTYTASDFAGNSASASFDVIVNDIQAPIISDIPADIVVPLPIGDTSVSVSWIEPTATDNDGIASFTSTHNPGDSFLLGTTTVTYTAVDTVGNISEASFDVVVISSVYTAVQDGDWNDAATWGGQVPPDSDNKLIPVGITVSNSATFTNLGNIQVLGTLNNECGATIANSGTIVGNPVSEVLCIPNLVYPLDGDLVNEEKPDLTWEVNSTEIRPILYLPNLENTANPGVPIELVSLSLVSAEPKNKALDGTYAWNVFVDIDPSYSPGYPFVADTVSSSVATYDVSIIDTTPPVISGIPDDIVIFVPEGATEAQALWIPPTATDNIDDVFFFTGDHLPGFNFGLGETLVTYTARDSSNNVSTASFTVTVIVIDKIAPVITGIPDDIITQLEEGEDTVTVSWIEPTATDNVGVTSFTSTHNPGDSFPLGTTIVTYTASDFAGNTTEESFTITVKPSGKFVEPEFQEDLLQVQIKFFEKQIDKWEKEIDKLEKKNSKLEERADKYDDKGQTDKAAQLRDDIASNLAEIEVLEDEIAVVQVSLGEIPVQSVEVEVQEDLSSKAIKGIEKEIKKWEKQLKILNFTVDQLEKRADRYDDRGQTEKAEKLREMADAVKAQIAVIDDILEVLNCAIDFS